MKLRLALTFTAAMAITTGIGIAQTGKAADPRRNFSDCMNLNSSCDAKRLTPREKKMVAVVAHRQNYEN